jgi:diguanylate cyclase (GGDEF)-like protein
LNVLALIPLLTAGFYLVLLAFALPQAGRRTGRNFVYYLILAGFWSFCSFMLHLDAEPSHTLLWNQILIVALLGTALAYYQFTLAYTKRRFNLLLYLGYGILAVIAVLSFSGRIIIYSQDENGIVDQQLTNIIYLIAAVGLAYSVLSLRLLILEYRSSTDPADRNRTLYLVVGWCILVLLTYTNAIPVLANWPLDHIGNLANAVIICYTVAQFHLLDIKMMARSVISFALTMLFIGVLAGGSITLVFHLFPGQPTISFVLFAVVAVLLLVALTRPVLSRIRRAVDRMFYPQTYQYRQAVLGFSAKMSHILNLNELADEMLPALCKALDVNWAGLLLQDGEQGNFNMRFVNPQPETSKEFSLSADSLIIAWLDKYGRALDPNQMDGIPEFRGLWQTEREQMTGSGLGLLYPMKSRDRVICVLAVGRKQTAKLFSQEDIQLISNMASQAGIIIENAQLFTQATIRANTDELTGLYNHRHFHERLEQEIARGSRFGSTFSLILMDIDLFKSYNDIYGHLAGDQVLRKVGHYIASSIRSIDLAFRYGGEEFAIILPEARWMTPTRWVSVSARRLNPRPVPVPCPLP